MVTAHRAGCEIALKVYGVEIPHEFDIVIADSFPFDIEFWQANKALDTAGEVVKKGGAVILVSPCYEGFSRTHSEILEFGYLPIETIKNLVKSGKIKHKVVGVHMIQAGTVAVEKAKLILVSTGIKKDEAEKVGFLWAQNAQEAFSKALKIVGKNPCIAVLKNAARMLPLVKKTGD
jgi:nickel-dependent lactate racemase